LHFPESDRLIATSLETLRQIPVTIAVAVGTEKIPSIVAAARAGWFNTLVTDAPTAAALLAACTEEPTEGTGN
jgi:DNA-binding transcriptional regulator LsrR (DeoR family)